MHLNPIKATKHCWPLKSAAVFPSSRSCQLKTCKTWNTMWGQSQYRHIAFGRSGVGSCEWLLSHWGLAGHSLHFHLPLSSWMYTAHPQSSQRPCLVCHPEPTALPWQLSYINKPGGLSRDHSCIWAQNCFSGGTDRRLLIMANSTLTVSPVCMQFGIQTAGLV